MRPVIGDNPLDLTVPPGAEAESGAEPSAEAGMAARSAALAVDGPDAEAVAHLPERGALPGQYLTFLLGIEEYGLYVGRVREIIEYPPVTRVPSTPSWIRGVINLRGSVVPVLDLARRFGLPESPLSKRTCLIVVEVVIDDDLAVMALVVDAVCQVVELDEAAIDEPPAFGTRVRVDYLLGVGQIPQGLVLILDLDRVLTLDEMRVAAGLDSATNLDPSGSVPHSEASSGEEE